MGFVLFQFDKAGNKQSMQNITGIILFLNLIKFYIKRCRGKHLHLHDLKVHMDKHEV